MSTRRTHSMPPVSYDNIPKTRGRCITALCASWKVFTCVFSHVLLVALVVAYCIIGAITFTYLEAEHERQVKTGISSIRGNLTEEIWRMTNEDNVTVLIETEWIGNVTAKLVKFEEKILNSMKTDGWDGNEDENKLQWTFSGSLFYSIIVITTIGYGHIAPKTFMGKISTIFYAILGIPLMLLCLSNIGDIMASSFRFIYWRVCCFICTREPKRTPSKRLRRQDTFRQNSRFSGRTQPSLRRSIRVSQRTADSGFSTFYEPSLTHAYSDTELRYTYGVESDFNSVYEKDRSFNRKPIQNRQQRFNRARNRDTFRDRHTIERERNITKQSHGNRHQDDLEPMTQVKTSNNRFRRAKSAAYGESYRNPDPKYNEPLTSNNFKRSKSKTPAVRAKSLDPRFHINQIDIDDFDDDPSCTTPVLCNKYAIDELNRQNGRLQQENQRSQSMPRPYRNNRKSALDQHRQSFSDYETTSRSDRLSQNQQPKRDKHYNRRYEPRSMSPTYLEPPLMSSTMPRRHSNFLHPPETGYEMQSIKRPKRRERPAPPPPPSPRIMSPMGFAVHRQARLQMYPDDDSLFGDDWDLISDMPNRIRPVPIWLCVFLVISYIIAGAFLFSEWEHWRFLDSVYFCFITLTTIGFGDFVPAQGVRDNSEISIALCSLYLLFGIALLAMSFNLVQEEVIANVKNVARRLGILKEEEDED